MHDHSGIAEVHISWDVTPRQLANRYRRFDEQCIRNVGKYQMTRSDIQEDLHLQAVYPLYKIGANRHNSSRSRFLPRRKHSASPLQYQRHY